MKIKEMMTKEEVQNAGIYQYNTVMNKEYVENKIIAVISTPYGHNYGGYQRNTTRAYICKNGGIETLFYNLKTNRANRAIEAWNKGDVGTVIPTYVWENYITNGYNTRRGLYANYESKKERINQLARSHADYLGGYDSTTDHNIRVAMRNN